MANPLVGYDNIIPLLAPVDAASTAQTTPYMDLRNSHNAAFVVFFGAITSTTTTDTYVLTVQCASAEGGTEAAIPFRYRLSGAVGANTWGAVTTCASTGLSMGVSDDNKIVWIEVAPEEFLPDSQVYRYARLVITDTPDMEAGLVGVMGFLQTRYRQTTHISATASASA